MVEGSDLFFLLIFIVQDLHMNEPVLEAQCVGRLLSSIFLLGLVIGQ